jgi:hypothetical protein
MIKCDSQKLFKYGLYMIIIYALLKTIPAQQIKPNDMLIIMSSLLIIIVLVDNVGAEFFVNITDENTKPLIIGSNTPYNNTLYTSYDEIFNIPNTPATTPSSSESNSGSNTDTGSGSNTDTGSGSNADTGSQILNDDTEKITKTTCDFQLDKIKNDFKKEINDLKQQLLISSNSGTQPTSAKYFNQLVKELFNNGILNDIDIKNINIKISNNLITLDDAISSLEKVKEEGIVKDKTINSDFIYSELAPEFYNPIGKRIINNWDNDYNLLDSTNWQVPMQRPPICIANEKCKVCPKETYPGTTLLKDWDTSRKVSNVTINKKWAANN